MAKITKEEALRYHAEGKPGKIEVVPTKPYSTQMDLSLAYSPEMCIRDRVITKPQLVKVGALGIKKKVRILTHLLLYCVYLFVSGFVNRSP